MSDYITKLIPYEGFERDALEGWLEDMTGQGLVLKDVTLFFASFERSEPCSIRYRIDPHRGGNLEQTNARRLQLKEMGWECVTLLHGTVYKTADQNLEMPPVIGRGSIINTRLQLFLPYMSPVLICLYILVVRPNLYGTSFTTINWTYVIRSSALYLMGTDILLIAIFLISTFTSTVSLIQLNRRLKNSEYADRSFHTERRAKYRAVVRTVIAACICGVFFLITISYPSTYPKDIPIEEYKGSIPFPILEEINTEEWQELKLGLHSLEQVMPCENYLMKDTNFLAPSILMTRQYGPTFVDEDGFSISKFAYTVDYYRLSNEALAKKVLADLATDCEYQPIPSQQGIQAMYARYTVPESQCLLLYYKNVVISVWYIGSTDLRDCIPLYESYLNSANGSVN